MLKCRASALGGGVCVARARPSPFSFCVLATLPGGVVVSQARPADPGPGDPMPSPPRALAAFQASAAAALIFLSSATAAAGFGVCCFVVESAKNKRGGIHHFVLWCLERKSQGWPPQPPCIDRSIDRSIQRRLRRPVRVGRGGLTLGTASKFGGREARTSACRRRHPYHSKCVCAFRLD